jgi:hypothetical protein
MKIEFMNPAAALIPMMAASDVSVLMGTSAARLKNKTYV